MKLLLVGAGQIGSRHLQSCLKFHNKLEIFVVDGAQESLEIAKIRATEIEQDIKHSVHYVTNMDDIDCSVFDFLILATGAGARFNVLSAVLEKFKVRYAILEKVLFQNLSAYDEARSLLQTKKVTTFVNCPLRVYPFFQKIKSQYFTVSNKTHFNYSGGDWVGMACNVIHYLDLVNYLTGEKLLDIDTQHLDPGFIQSKRPGYIEFTGKMTASYNEGSTLSFESIRDNKNDSVMDINHGPYRFVIDELSGKYKIYNNHKLIEDSQYPMVYQSDLSHNMLEQLIDNGKCDLNDFDGSMEIHQIFIERFLAFYNLYTDTKTSILPVT